MNARALRLTTISLLMLILFTIPEHAYADNCGDLQDCFFTILTALLALLAIIAIVAILWPIVIEAGAFALDFGLGWLGDVLFADLGEAAEVTATMENAEVLAGVDDSIETTIESEVTAETEVTTEMEFKPQGRYSWLSDINWTGGTRNCVQCARAVDAMLANPGVYELFPVLGEGESVATLEAEYGSFFSESSYNQIEQQLLAQGNGSRGMIAVFQPGSSVGHVFNVVNDGGQIWYLDGQTGIASQSGEAVGWGWRSVSNLIVKFMPTT